MKCKLCERESVVRGYCRRCYETLKRNGELEVKKHKNVLVYGGGINDMPRGWAKENGRTYRVWVDMIRRCYSAKLHERRPNYVDCCVCEKWIKLSGFLDDLPRIFGYDDWLSNPNSGIALDKDILYQGNNEYSLEKCAFVSIVENSKEGQFRNGRQRPIIRIADDGSIKIYESTIAPQHEDGFQQGSVYNCCIGKSKTYKGYKWMFLEDYESQICK